MPLPERQTAFVHADIGLASRLKWLMFFRLAVIILSAAAILGIEGQFRELPRHLPPYWTLSAAILLTLVYLFWAWSGQGLRKLAVLQALGDVVLVSLLVYFTGFDKLFALLYFGVIIACVMLLGTRWGLFCASFSAVWLCSISLLYWFAFGDYLDRPLKLPGVDPAINPGTYRAGPLFPYLFFFTLSLHAVALLAGRLREQASRIRILNEEILETMSGGVMAVDRNGTVAFANAQAGKLLGISGAKLPGSSFRQVLGKEMAELVTRVLRGRETIRREITGGDGVPLEVSLSPLEDDPDRPVRGVVAIINDLSVRRRLEEATQLADRFRVLLEMSAGMAHEIRNPLASIRGAAQELDSSIPPEDEGRQLLQVVMRESDRLNKIISDFLEYASDRPPNIGLCDLSRILAQVAELIDARRDGEAVELKLDTPREAICRGDEDQLKQVFLNLALNAVEACSKGDEVLLYCAPRVTERGGSGSCYMIEIRDSGRGISPEDLPKVFDPFVTSKARGAGMGLAMARKIVEAHQGTIELESKKGEGTTCRVWLPA